MLPGAQRPLYKLATKKRGGGREGRRLQACMASSVTRKLLPVKLQNGVRLIFVCVPWKAFPCLDFERTSDKCEKCVPVSTNAKRRKCSLWIPFYGKCICQTGCFWTQNVLKQIKERAYLALFPKTQMLPHSVSSSTLKRWVIKHSHVGASWRDL